MRRRPPAANDDGLCEDCHALGRLTAPTVGFAAGDVTAVHETGDGLHLELGDGSEVEISGTWYELDRLIDMVSAVTRAAQAGGDS